MKSSVVITLVSILFVALFVGIVYTTQKPSVLAEFAQCLEDKEAVFYGAFWCPSCQNQKALFGSAAPSLPYVECSTPNGKAQLQICIDEKITGYPTWEFADKSRLTGELSLQTLADNTGCELPEGE